MRTSSGVERISTDVIKELRHDDFPAPVAPAINRCGVVARFIMMACPLMSRPMATSMG